MLTILCPHWKSYGAGAAGGGIMSSNTVLGNVNDLPSTRGNIDRDMLRFVVD